MATSAASHPVCSIPSVLSSAPRDWEGILVEQMRLPPLELPEHDHHEHLIRLHTGAPLVLHWKEKGRSRKRRLMPGDICVVPADAPRQLAWGEDADFLRILLAPAVLRQVSEKSGTADNRLTEHYGIVDPQMERLLLALQAELGDGAADGNLFAESLKVALSVHLLRHYSIAPSNALSEPVGSGLSPAVLRQVTDYLQDNLAENFTLSDLAAIAGISPAYFCTLFKRAAGMPPHRYLLNLRVERAAQLLRGGNLSISQVAAEVGFADQSHLTRYMKRLRGVTPGALVLPRHQL